MAKVIIVLLRRPNRRDPKEMRSDPFWEFGSFGCTGCHRKNLLNPRKTAELEGARLAFVQGGRSEMRLVLLSPPVTVVKHKVRCEVKWHPPRMPFQYERAPLVIDREGQTDFPALLQEFADGNRSTLVGCFASAFRSRRDPLPGPIGNRLVRRWQQITRKADKGAFASRYEEALPCLPPIIDRSRKDTYRKEIDNANGRVQRQSCCRAPAKRQSCPAGRSRQEK